MWSVEWTVARRAGKPAEGSTVRVAGELAMLQAPATVRQQPLVSTHNATYVGVYSAEFGAVDDTLYVPGELPEAVLAQGAGDSVTVVLNPRHDHGALVMAGRRSGDEISGNWYRSSQAGSAGTFVMRRR